jgi:ribosomal protein S27E
MPGMETNIKSGNLLVLKCHGSGHLQIILHLNKITKCSKMTTFKVVFTFDVFFSAETTLTARWHVFHPFYFDFQCTRYFWHVFRFLFMERKRDSNVTCQKCGYIVTSYITIVDVIIWIRHSLQESITSTHVQIVVLGYFWHVFRFLFMERKRDSNVTCQKCSRLLLKT